MARKGTAGPFTPGAGPGGPKPQSRIITAIAERVDSWRGFPLLAATEPWPQDGRYQPAADGERPVSETTGLLLRHWFQPEPHFVPFTRMEAGQAVTGRRAFRYWPHQRRLVETFVYLHEVCGVRRTEDLWRFGGQEPTFTQRDPWAKLGGQLATGSGKTKMMSLIIAWAQLNAAIEGEEWLGLGRHALLIAPGLFVKDRLLQDFNPPDGSPSVFRTDPVLPRELEHAWDVQVYGPDTCPRRLDPARGALVVTNYHQLLREDDSAAPPLFPGKQQILFDEGDPRKLEEDTAPLVSRFRRSRGILVLNDEAHHVGDEPEHGQFEAAAAARKRLGEDAQTAMAWIRSLRALNGSETQPGRVGLQTDLSATLFEETGGEKAADKTVFPDPTLFRHAVVKYGLADAIKDGIVKKPVLERVKATTKDDGTPEPTVRLGQPDAWLTYQPLLVAGIKRWVKVRDDMRANGDPRKPILFLLCAHRDEAAEIANFLTYGEAAKHDEDVAGKALTGWKDEASGETLFLDTSNGVVRSTVVQIHIGAQEERDEKAWASVRSAVNAVDEDTHQEPVGDGTFRTVANPYNVVVSVMMLKEGWDVRNVKVIVPLRSCGSRTLTEQTLGRGLRKMHAPRIDDDGRVTLRPEQLYVIEHPSFATIIDGISDLVDVKEGEEIGPERDYVGIVPREPREAREAVDVRIVRFEGIRRSLPDWRRSFDVKKLPAPAMRLDWRDSFSDTEIETSVRAAGESESSGFGEGGGQKFSIGAVPTYRDFDHVLEAAYVRPLIAELNAAHAHNSDVKLVVRQYLERRAFHLGRGMALSFDAMIDDEPDVRRIAIGNLLRSEVIEGVQTVLRGPLRDAIHGRVSTEEAVLDERRASELAGYQAVREHVFEAPGRTVFQKAAFDSADELRVALMLDRCPEVSGWLYNHRGGVGHSVEYDWLGRLSNYFPDFVVRATIAGRIHNFVIEVKGRLDDRDKAKIAAGRRAVALLARHDAEPWHYLLLLENPDLARRDVSWWESMSSVSLAQIAAHVDAYESGDPTGGEAGMDAAEPGGGVEGTQAGFAWRWHTREEITSSILNIAEGEHGLSYDRLLEMGPRTEADPDRALGVAEALAAARGQLRRVFTDTRTGQEISEDVVAAAVAEKNTTALAGIEVGYRMADGSAGVAATGKR